MNQWKLSVLLFVLMALSICSAESRVLSVTMEQIETSLQNAPKIHPSLMVGPAQERIAQANRNSADRFFEAMENAVIRQADRYVGRKPVERIMTGRRLLSVSRDCLNRVTLLAAAYRMTGDLKYFTQAEAELLAAAAFSDWNPSHFLDVGEMTAALGIGYDRFYVELSDDSKSRIRTAIVEKGLNPSFGPNNWWVNTEHNWNQVCHGGLTLGALAIRNDEPELAARIIHRAVNSITVAMDEYAPDGAYPEGPGYWSYGTMYNVALIAALQSTLGTDFGLSNHQGFANAGDYYLHTTAPSGLYFNYADCGRGGGVNPTLFWFAHRYQRPYLLHQQLPRLWPDGATEITARPDWMYPMLLVWGQTITQPPAQLNWLGRGRTPVAVFRSSWTDPAAAYLAVKGGTASSNHAHMDAGSFIYEADGVRWAFDLGSQDYTRMESLGLSVFDRSQNSDRWKIFRHSNFAHNTLTVNGQLHNVRGVSSLKRFRGESPRPHAVIEMSDVFKNQLEKAARGVTLLENRAALIQDEWKAGDEAATVRWTMVAPGKIEILTPTTARLSEKGKTLTFDVHSPKPVSLKIITTEPAAEWDEPNPNTSILAFEVELKPDEDICLQVMLTPGSAEKIEWPQAKPLMEWSGPLDEVPVKASAPR
jgi:hypothetical protein